MASSFDISPGIWDIVSFSLMSDHDPITQALAEDIGDGDLTSAHFVDADAQATATIIAKEDAVVAGAEVAAEVFRRVDSQLKVQIVCNDGVEVKKGDVVISVAGSARSILTGERVALNFIQQLSGVATLTRRFVQETEGTKAKILDTRKTTPGLRQLEKAAVVAGGGTNHRIGLYDMVMVKDNHLAMNGVNTTKAAADLQDRINRFKTEHPDIRIELEADTLQQAAAFLALNGVDVILLDNMSLGSLCEAVKLRGDKPVLLEASGGVSLKTVHAIAATGVDFISAGALTHSAVAVDFSLELIRTESNQIHEKH